MWTDDANKYPCTSQTEEEPMPAGRYHGIYLQRLTEMLNPLCERLGLWLLPRVFLYYADADGKQQYTSFDLLIAPIFSELTEEQAARPYDVRVEPLPVCLVDFIAPNIASGRDIQEKYQIASYLGVPQYLVLDIVDTQGQLRSQIGIRAWKTAAHQSEVQPNTEGYYELDSIGIQLRADGQQLLAQTLSTREWLRTSTELFNALKASERARQQAEVLVKQEQVAREQAEVRVREELIAGIELGLELKFGSAGIDLISDIRQLSDEKALRSLRDRIRHIGTLIK